MPSRLISLALNKHKTIKENRRVDRIIVDQLINNLKSAISLALFRSNKPFKFKVIRRFLNYTIANHWKANIFHDCWTTYMVHCYEHHL